MNDPKVAWSKFWPTLIPAVLFAVDALMGVAGPWLASHPTASLFVVTVVTAVANAVKPTK